MGSIRKKVVNELEKQDEKNSRHSLLNIVATGEIVDNQIAVIKFV